MSHIVQTWLLHYHKLPSWCPYFVKLIAENAQNFHFYGLLVHSFLSGGKYLTEVNVASGKVHIFWEGHKFLRNLHRRFVLCTVVMVKSTVEILQNFEAFSEYKYFKRYWI